jgi:thiamine kinase-like enzyme
MRDPFLDNSQFLNNIINLVESKCIDVVVEEKGYMQRFSRHEDLVAFGENIKNITTQMIHRSKTLQKDLEKQQKLE